MTPDEVRQLILAMVAKQVSGPDAHYKSEVAAEQAESDAEKAFDIAFINAEYDDNDRKATVEERKARARLETEDARIAAFIARAEHNRVRLKIRQIDNSLVAYQAVLKSILADGA